MGWALVVTPIPMNTNSFGRILQRIGSMMSGTSRTGRGRTTTTTRTSSRRGGLLSGLRRIFG